MLSTKKEKKRKNNSIELQLSVNTDFKYFDKTKQTALQK